MSVLGIVGAVYQNFFAPPVVVKGARIGDLTVTGSTYGAYINQLYGTSRLSGQMIWATKIVEKKHSSTSGGGVKGLIGKGGLLGPSTATKTVTFTYFGNFAIAFCRGPVAGLVRMWADGKLLYDRTGAEQPLISPNSLRFRFYPGDEEQLPDPAIETDKGAGNVSGHRGLCYVVFELLPLQSFGNRIPNITAEIATVVDEQLGARSLDQITGGEGGISSAFANAMAIDLYRGYGYLVDNTSTPNVLRRFELATMAEDLQLPMAEFESASVHPAGPPWRVMDDGSVITTLVGNNFTPIARIDPDTLQVSGTWGNDAVLGSQSSSQFWWLADAAPITAIGPVGPIYFALTLGQFGQVGLLKWDSTPVYVWGADDSTGSAGYIDNGAHLCRGIIAAGYGEGWLIDDALAVVRVRVQYDAAGDTGSDVTTGVQVLTVGTVPGGGTPEGIFYDFSDDAVLVMVSGGTGTRILKLSKDGTVAWTTAIAATGGTNQSIAGDAFYWAHGATVYGVNTATGELIMNGVDWSGQGAPSNAGATNTYDPTTNTILVGYLSDVARLFLGRATGGGAGLDDIVTSICGQVGLAPGDLDVGDLTDQVAGFVISRQAEARAALQTLMQAYLFDGSESDHKLTFPKRGGSSGATILQLDMAAADSQTGAVLPERRVQEVDLAVALAVNYLDKSRDYQQGTQNARRIGLPLPAMYSANNETVDLPLVLTAEAALRLGERLLYAGWLERVSYKITLPPKFLAIDPADVVTVTLDSGLAAPLRITKADIGADLSLQLEGVAADGPVYVESSIGADAGTIPVQTIPSDGPTRLFLPQVPLLRDVDDTGGATSLAYAFAGSYGADGWAGAGLYESSDAAAWNRVAEFGAEVAYGVAQSALGDAADPFRTDEVNTLRLRMIRGGDAIAACTQRQMLDGLNGAILGREVIQFRDVTVNADGSFVLSGLLRGRRGTELECPNHRIGDVFILLDADTAQALSFTLGEIGATRYFKPVTYGGFFDRTPLTASIHRGYDLKPYAVVQQAAAPDGGGGIDLSWVRRTRLGGELLDGIGTVPLAETTESYSIDIYDMPGGAVLRTLASTSDTKNYAAGDVTTDFGSVPSDLTFAVYQISAAVGRGFGKAVTVPVA